MIDLVEAARAYFLDVFVDRFDALVAFGIFGQLLFTARFLAQWVASERAGRSVIPLAFWLFAIGGGLATLAYGLMRREPIIIMGQAFSLIVYVRNLMLISRARGRAE